MADGFTTKTIPQLGALASILATDKMVFQRGEGPATRAPASALVALLDQLGAGARAAERAEQAADQAIIAGQSAGGHRYETTYAEAEAAVGTYADQDYVHVFKDEDHGNRQTLYRKSGGVLGFVKDVTLAMLFEIRGRFTFIEEYINPANGIMADTLALRAAAVAAGPGGRPLGKPGAEYLLFGGVTAQVGQEWLGNGARIKRCDAILSTTTSAVVAEVSTTVEVDDASEYRVGMDVAIQTSAVAGTVNRRITAIEDNEITVDGWFDISIAAGATLTTSFKPLTNAGGAGARIAVRGWEIDGNKDNNLGFTNWVNHNEINISGPGVAVEHNWVHDCVGEGIYAFGGSGGDTSDDPYVVQFNRVERCNGNGIHMSAATAGKVMFNWVKTTNIRPNGNIGHDDGCIAFSFNGPDWIVMGNYCEDGKAGIGPLGQYPYTGDGLIAYNVVRDCEVPISRQLASASGGRVQVIGNRFYDSGLWDLNQTGAFAADQGFEHLTISLNQFFNTRLEVQKGHDIAMSGNRFRCPDDVTNTIVRLFDCQRVTSDGDTVIGGSYGIGVEGANTAEIEINSPRVSGQYNRSINLVSDVPIGAVDIVNPRVRMAAGTTAAADYVGIQLVNGATVKGGSVVIGVASTAAGIECPNGGAGVRGAIVQGVTVDAPDMAHTIRMGGGARNNIVVGNFLSAAVSESGAGAVNTVADNYLLTAF